MINPFKKKREDVIDLVELRKRGIIKDSPLRRASETQSTSPFHRASQTQSSSAEGATGFLGDFAGVATGETDISQTTSSEDASGIKNKLDDFEYKIDSFGDRIYKLIQRIEVLEKKIERLEGRH